MLQICKHIYDTYVRQVIYVDDLHARDKCVNGVQLKTDM